MESKEGEQFSDERSESSSENEPFVSEEDESSSDDGQAIGGETENVNVSAQPEIQFNDNNIRPFFINLEDTDTSMDDSGYEISEHIENSQPSNSTQPTESSAYRNSFNVFGIKPLTSLAAEIVMKNDNSRKFEHCLARGSSNAEDSAPVKHHNLEESIQAEPWYPPNLSVTSSDFSAIGRDDASTPIPNQESEDIVTETEDTEHNEMEQTYEPEGVIEDLLNTTDAVGYTDVPPTNLDDALLQNSIDGIVDYNNVPGNHQIDDPAVLGLAQMGQSQPEFHGFIGQNVPVIQYPYVQQVVINDSYQIPAPADNPYVQQYIQPPPPVYPTPAVIPTEIQQEIFESPEIQATPDCAEFQYPAIYVSDSGLITVLLKHDISVEMTVDQTIRLVCHQRKLVVATNSRGDSSCIYHPAAKIIQKRTSINTEVYLGRRAQMTSNSIIFGNNFNTYKFDYTGINPTTFQFPDISRDTSVQFLFESADYGPAVVSRSNDITMNAHYEFLPQDGVIVRINGVKIIQAGRGDVTIVNGPKYLKMSPVSTVLRLNTHFVEMSVEMNWNVKIRRGCHTLNASHLGFVVSNGKIESGFDESNHVKAFHLPRRIPIRISPRRHRRHIPPANRRATALGGQPLESF